MDISGTLPRDWYQGMKAIAQYPVPSRKKMESVFKKFNDLKGRVADIDGVADINALKAHVVA